MKRGTWVVSVLSVAALAIAPAMPVQAQHLHRHGDHFDVHQNVPHGHDAAGHLVDRFGHHIDGDGRHTGAVGVYENGSASLPYSHRWSGYYPSYSGYPYYSSPYYSSSLYSGSLYSGSAYAGSLYGGSLYGGSLYGGSQYTSPLYSAPLYSGLGAAAPATLPSAPPVNAAPLGAGNVVRNRVPVPAVAPRGGSFVLTNPRDSGGPIRYSLDSFTYTINPGETQTVQLDHDWVITFDNGLNKTVTYRMEEGVYEFTVTPQDGWNLVKRTTQIQRNAALPVPPVAPTDVDPVPQSQPGRRAL